MSNPLAWTGAIGGAVAAAAGIIAAVGAFLPPERGAIRDARPAGGWPPRGIRH
jgi:hypothetical protein